MMNTFDNTRDWFYVGSVSNTLVKHHDAEGNATKAKWLIH